MQNFAIANFVLGDNVTHNAGNNVLCVNTHAPTLAKNSEEASSWILTQKPLGAKRRIWVTGKNERIPTTEGFLDILKARFFNGLHV